MQPSHSFKIQLKYTTFAPARKEKTRPGAVPGPGRRTACLFFLVELDDGVVLDYEGQAHIVA